MMCLGAYTNMNIFTKQARTHFGSLNKSVMPCAVSDCTDVCVARFIAETTNIQNTCCCTHVRCMYLAHWISCNRLNTSSSLSWHCEFFDAAHPCDDACGICIQQICHFFVYLRTHHITSLFVCGSIVKCSLFLSFNTIWILTRLLTCLVYVVFEHSTCLVN